MYLQTTLILDRICRQTLGEFAHLSTKYETRPGAVDILHKSCSNFERRIMRC